MTGKKGQNPGRHRLGTPGLQHCSQLIDMSTRPTHRRPHGRHSRTRVLGTAGFAALLGTLTVGGWLTVSGATAMAEMIKR
jgi:hypothetical protein